jgi:hypothetical protein
MISKLIFRNQHRTHLFVKTRKVSLNVAGIFGGLNLFVNSETQHFDVNFSYNAVAFCIKIEPAANKMKTNAFSIKNVFCG